MFKSVDLHAWHDCLYKWILSSLFMQIITFSYIYTEYIEKAKMDSNLKLKKKAQSEMHIMK